MVFPAYAGMIPCSKALANWTKRVPRIRGDDPANGNALYEVVRVFPAYAGMIPGSESHS